MNVTKVVFRSDEESSRKFKSIVLCDIVLDDKLKLYGARLYKKKRGDYFLVFPSKQDTYQELRELNKGIDLEIPEVDSSNMRNGYEEFFFPMDSEFYRNLLGIVLDGYRVYCKKRPEKVGKYNFIPKDGTL